MQTLATARKHHTLRHTYTRLFLNHTAYVAAMQPCTTTKTEIQNVVTHSDTQLYFEGSVTVQGKFGMPSFLQAANYLVPKYIFEYIIFM